MQGFFKKSLCVAALTCAIGLNASSTTTSTANSVVTFITPRALGTDGALRMSCDAVKQNLFGKEDSCFWGTLSVAAGGGQTFRGHRIAECLFGSDLNCTNGCPSITISGKCAPDRGANDWLADYFGLPTDFVSTVSFKPRVTRAFVDFNAYVGLDSWWEGLYVTLRVPFEHVRYKLGFSEDITSEGVNGYDQGYFSEAAVPRSNLLNSFEDFVANCKVPNLSGTTFIEFEDLPRSVPITSQVVFDPLSCARMYTCKGKTKNGVSDLSASAGWNFFLDEDYHLGAFILASAPTGSRAHGAFLFEPMVGGGHRWNLGGGISGHVMLWQSDDEESTVGFYVDGSVTHEFRSRQTRFFDLKGKPNSRYMLAEKLTSPSANLFAGATAGSGNTSGATNIPTAQFANEFTSVANLTCCDVNVSVDVQGQVVAMLNYSWKDFSWDIGYEFWGRSCDKISVNCECQCPLDAAPNTWALKGDAHVYGFVVTDPTSPPPAARSPIALSATDSSATIHQGDNVPVGTTCSTGTFTALTDTRTNPNIDNAQFAFTGTTTASNQLMSNANLIANTTGFGQQRTSFNPVFLSSDDVDICGAQSKGMSHTVFSAISYAWSDWSDKWTPYVGIGGKAEFAHDFGSCESSCDDNGCSTSTTSTSASTDCCDDGECHRCNFSQWAAWIKLGVAFN